MTRPRRPDRRLAPRPLPAHLASAVALWTSSRSALPSLNSISPTSSAGPSSRLGESLRLLAAEIDACGTERVAGALEHEITRRAEGYLSGLEAYRRHPYRRIGSARPMLWQEGATRILDYGSGDRTAPVVLVVPSLINRYYVLDLLPERSFLRHLAESGLRPLVIDWGAPGLPERRLDLGGYSERLDRALAAAADSADRPIAIAGYCMGGLLALAAALRNQCRISCLALLATPWDFDAGRGAASRLLALAGEQLGPLGINDSVSVELVQSFFFLIDPFLAERKFVRLSRLDPEGDAARSFVALEDWINDGVPLGAAVASDCVRSWYRDNEPGRGVWRVVGQRVAPGLWRRPALVVVPGRDRIVPPLSAEPLAAAISGSEMLRPALGHVGMMAAARAPTMLWTPIAHWLRAHMNG
jgi:polyhydroxyalkanoate synthase subunit PhaC